MRNMKDWVCEAWEDIESKNKVQIELATLHKERENMVQWLHDLGKEKEEYHMERQTLNSTLNAQYKEINSLWHQIGKSKICSKFLLCASQLTYIVYYNFGTL